MPIARIERKRNRDQSGVPVKKLNLNNLRILAALPMFALASCVAAPEPAPPPVSQPAPTPTTAPVQQPMAAPPANWIDAPATPGDWIYRGTAGGSQALFGTNSAEPVLTLQCSRAAGQVLLVRRGDATGPVPMRIMTETESRAVTVAPDRGSVPSLVVNIPARDGLLDAMAISKGRFAVEIVGLPTLYVPSWPEISRVIEDCR